MAMLKKATDEVVAQLALQYENAKKRTEEFYQETVHENAYYISSVHGDDSNDGRSEATPWRSCEMLKSVALQSGDAVLFECGSIFREQMKLTNGVTYTSYGIGKKPLFYGSIDASSPADWESLGDDLYRFKQEIVWHNDIGNVVFDHGRAWGIKIQKCDDGDVSLALKNVTNGQEHFAEISGVPFKGGMDLPRVNLAYHHDPEGYVYLCCKEGNPAEVFSSIELSQSVKIFNGGYTENVTFSNLRFAYIACFAIRTVGCKNIVLRNCSFEFIGGAIQFGYECPWRNYRTRYGNAFENWGGSDHVTVENCYFNQIYDAGITTQSNDKDAHQENLRFEGNVFDCNQYAFELWSGGSECRFTNISVKNNIGRNIGCGMTTQRPDKGHESFFNSKGKYPMVNCVVSNNVVNGSVGNVMRCNQLHTEAYDGGYTMDENVYLHRKGSPFALISDAYPAHNSGLQSVPYTQETVAMLNNEWFEKHGEFYYLD